MNADLNGTETGAENFRIRKGRTEEFPALADLWRRSVEATHHFLTPADIDALYLEVRDIYLGAVELWVAEITGSPAAFMGLSHEEAECKVEMLFVEPNRRGQGLGSRLLEHARKAGIPLSVDVNEQNPAGLKFYLTHGFTQTGRSELDGQGRPFPLLHLIEHV